ncbi:MAG TPA: hypothetical protein VK708_16645 [Bryobacteraceae bacterium]|nr:hypothetical protein [Bryobacteraceae bacterium]
MKIMVAISVAAAIGGNAWAIQPGHVADHQVTVCIDQVPAAGNLPRAEMLAANMFSNIGVKLHWRHSCPAAGDSIQIGISVKTPANDSPGALAYAMPYEGVHIVVFYDRINHSARGDLSTVVLAHVLVHEITHVLQGVDRHSESGVMKAHWTARDYSQMKDRPLPFTDWDIELIHNGLAARAGRLAARTAGAEISSADNLDRTFEQFTQ